MKILVAGDWHSELHEEVVRNALCNLGHTVAAFKWFSYFELSYGGASAGDLALRAQNKYIFGPKLRRLNRDFLDRVVAFRPDWIFLYRGTHVWPETIREIKAQHPHIVIVGYNNDDPFAPSQPRYLWRHFLASVPDYDLVLAYRHHNLSEFVASGARRVKLLRSWFVPERNRPVKLTLEQEAKFACDVVFVGHFEPDQRLECLEAIAREGYSVRIFGPQRYWEKPLSDSAVLGHLAPVKMVWGDDYNRALCGAKIALCFLSKLNRDTYTRRCFEIPATGTLMLSEYSDDLAGMFREGEEADYFRDPDEMLRKIRFYMADDKSRRQVAAAGRERVISDKHDVESRMRQVVDWVKEING